MSSLDKGKISLYEKYIFIRKLTKAMTRKYDPQIIIIYRAMLIEQLDGTENTKRDKKPNDRNPGMILPVVSLFSLDGITSQFQKKDDENETIPSTIPEVYKEIKFFKNQMKEIMNECSIIHQQNYSNTTT